MPKRWPRATSVWQRPMLLHRVSLRRTTRAACRRGRACSQASAAPLGLPLGQHYMKTAADDETDRLQRRTMGRAPTTTTLFVAARSHAERHQTRPRHPGREKGARPFCKVRNSLPKFIFLVLCPIPLSPHVDLHRRIDIECPESGGPTRSSIPCQSPRTSARTALFAEDMVAAVHLRSRVAA